MLEINVYLPKFSYRVISIINIERIVYKFYRRHNDLVSQFNVGFRTRLHGGLLQHAVLQQTRILRLVNMHILEKYGHD